MKIYSNNECSIEIERANSDEAKVNINGQNLIWISREDQELFREQLTQLLDKFRI